MTGEKKSNESSVSPAHPFNPKEGNWGTLEFVARLETLNSDQRLINSGFATGSDDLWATTGGFNWYLNKHIRAMTNYVYTKFDDIVANAGGKSYEHAFLIRFQFSL